MRIFGTDSFFLYFTFNFHSLPGGGCYRIFDKQLSVLKTENTLGNSAFRILVCVTNTDGAPTTCSCYTAMAPTSIIDG